MAFCHRELPSPNFRDAPSQEMGRQQSSSPQNVATSTLQACATQSFPIPRNNAFGTTDTFSRHDKLPPTFREADLPGFFSGFASTALILLFAKKFFRAVTTQNGRRSQTAATGSTRMRWRRANILAPGFRASRDASSFPPSPPNLFGDWPWEIVSSHSSATAPESHGNSSHRSTTATNKELPPEVAACAWALKIYLSQRAPPRVHCVFFR
jgi:hypothetical protein